MRRSLLLAGFLCLTAAAQQGANPIATGMQLARQGKYLEAEHVLKAFAEQNPTRPEAQAALGQLYYHFGYYASAIPVLQRAAELEPSNRESRISAAVCLFKAGDPAKAEEETKKLLAETPPPNDIDLTLTYAQFLYEKRDLDGALAQAKAAVGFAPLHPIGFFWLARILQAKGATKEATTAAEHCVDLNPQLPYARNLLVHLYRAQGRLEDAERQAEWVKSFEARKANP